MTTEVLQYVACLLSAIACLVSIGTFVRNGKWRDTDEAKDLVGRIDDAENRLTKLETHQSNLATKADIEGLKAELEGDRKTVNAKIDGVAQSVKTVLVGVNRLETFFLEKGVK